MAFMFGFPKAFGTIKKAYFSPSNIAKSVFSEVYYMLTRQYGVNLIPTKFEFVATKASSLARHVAMKNKIQYLTCSSCISNAQVQAFISAFNTHNTHEFGCLDILDI